MGAVWQAELDECVTYARSQGERGLQTSRLEGEKSDPKFVDSQISRFGVGLFDAAFAAG
jgi:hypothetical protein